MENKDIFGLLGLSHLRLKDDSFAEEISNDSLGDSTKSSVKLHNEKEKLVYNKENLMNETFSNPENRGLVNEQKSCAENNKFQDHSTIHSTVSSGFGSQEEGNTSKLSDREDSRGHLYSKLTNEGIKKGERIYESKIKYLVNRDEGHSENVRRPVIYGDKIISNSNKYNSNHEKSRSSENAFDKIESFDNQTNGLPKKTTFDYSEGTSRAKGATAQDNTREFSKGTDKPVHAPYIPPEIDESDEKFFEAFEKGEHFDKLTNCKVEVSGPNAPKEPIQSFQDANLTPRILENIKKLGYTALTPVQKWSIPIIMDGRDMMASAQTGSGKTAAFLVPVLSGLVNNENILRDCANSDIPSPAVLIIAPTRELTRQIHVEIRKFAHGTIIKSVPVYGGLDRIYQMRQLKGAAIVVGTVGRLQDFVRNKKIDLSSVKFLILDEADRMLDMGFHDEVLNLVSLCGGLQNKNRQTLLFSATFPLEIQKLAFDILRDYLFVTVGTLGQANENIKQVVWRVDNKNKKEKLIEVLKEIGSEKVIVFFQTKRNADALCITLGDFLDRKITAIHGDLNQKEREEAIKFFREGKAEILMATSVAARGLDIQGVKHVINYDLPKDIDEYIHRIGRTARCGNSGRALSFFSFQDDFHLAGPLVRVLGETEQEVPKWLETAAEGGPSNREFSTRGGDGRRNGRFPVRRPQNESENGSGGPSSQTQSAEEEWM